MVYAVYISSKSKSGWNSDGRMGATTKKKDAQKFAKKKIKNSNRPTRAVIRKISGKMGYVDLKTGESVLPTRKRYRGNS